MTRSIALSVRKTSRHTLVLLALLSAGMFVAASCSSGSSSAEKEEEIDSPLGLNDAGFIVQQNRVEEAVQSCMKKAGFEYTPVDSNATKAAITGTSGLTDDEYRRQFGYGISTVFEKLVEVSRSGSGLDPNVTFRGNLDAAGQSAYDKALTGGLSDLSVAAAVDSARAGSLEGLGGCVGESTTLIFGDSNVISALAKIEELDNTAESDSRLVAARADWSTCMKKRGFDYAEPNDVDGAIQDKLVAVVGAGARSIGETGNYSPLAFGNAELPNYDKAALAALQSEELLTAQADLDCEEEFVVDIEDKVKAEYTKKFSEENAALLTKAKSKLGVK